MTRPSLAADCAGALLWVFKAFGNLPRWDLGEAERINDKARPARARRATHSSQ